MNKQVSFTTESTIHKLLLFDGGKTRLTVSSLNGTDNFKYGESINFNINVDNTRGKVNVHKCKVVLRRIINFKARNSEIKRTFVDELISKETTTDTLPGENRNFVTNVNLAKIENKNFEINNSGIPYNNITDINFFLTSMKSLLLDCSYTLKFTLYFDSHVKYEDRPRVGNQHLTPLIHAGQFPCAVSEDGCLGFASGHSRIPVHHTFVGQGDGQAAGA